jgi:hypothetical protein
MFTTHTLIRRLLGVIALAAAACTFGAAPAAAQLDPGFKWILQLEDGRWVKRGEIFVPDKTDPNKYVEHWVLYPGYTYPSQTVDVTMRLKTPPRALSSERAFFAQRFPAGARYVHVVAHESDVIPLSSPLQIPTGLR